LHAGTLTKDITARQIHTFPGPTAFCVHVRVASGRGRLLSFAEMLPFVSSSCSINAEEGVACAWVGLHEGERWVRLTSPDEQRLDAAAAEDPTATVAMLGGRVRLGARLELGAVHGPSL
jgi:hypothetical protein